MSMYEGGEGHWRGCHGALELGWGLGVLEWVNGMGGIPGTRHWHWRGHRRGPSEVAATRMLQTFHRFRQKAVMLRAPSTV